MICVQNSAFSQYVALHTVSDILLNVWCPVREYSQFLEYVRFVRVAMSSACVVSNCVNVYFLSGCAL